MTILNDKYLLKLYRTAGTLADVPKAQANVSIVRGALTNLNGRYLSAYTAEWKTINGYGCYQIKYNNAVLTVTKAGDYMENMSGSRFVPTYNYEKPANSLFIFASDLSFWKPQFDNTNGLLLYPAGKLTSYSDFLDLKNVTELEINNLKSIVYDTVAAVEEYDEDYAGILPNPTSVNSKPVIDETKCQLAKIFGNSVVKNQLVNISDVSTISWSGGTYSITNNKITIVCNASESTINAQVIELNIPIIAGHKYYVRSTGITSSAPFLLYGNTVQLGIGESIQSPSTSGTVNLRCYKSGGFTEETTYEFYLQVFDLTQRFGSNDAIPADLLADPTLWNKYIKDTDFNTGTLVDSVVNKISSFDSSDNKLGEILINQTLKGAVNAHDTIEFVEQENGTFNAVKTSNIGTKIFAGTESWNFNSTNNYFESSNIENVGMSATILNIISDSGLILKGLYYQTTNNGRLRIYLSDNSQLTSASDLTTYFSNGKKLYFELATPTTEVIATGLTLDEVAFLIKLGGYIETNADNVAPNIKLAYIVKDFQE